MIAPTITREWVDEQLAISDAATEGPWEWTGAVGFYDEPERLNSPDGAVLYPSDEWKGYPECGQDLRINSSYDADAAFIPAARDGYPAALRALSRVLDECDNLDMNYRAFADRVRAAIEGK